VTLITKWSSRTTTSCQYVLRRSAGKSKRSALKSHTDRVTECFVPSKMTSKRHNVPWMNRSLRCLCRKKNRFYKKGRRSGSPSSWTRYKESKTAVTKSLWEARNNYIGSIINNAFRDNDIKLFWRFIKSQCNNDGLGITLLKSGDHLVADASSKAELINHQFKLVFSKEDTTTVPTLQGPRFPSISNITIDGVGKLLSNLSANKASRPDNIPCRV